MDIFLHLHPNNTNLADGKMFSRRSEDKTASARIQWHKGFPVITDFGDRDRINGIKAIPYLMIEKGYEYYDALLYIEDVIIGQKIEPGKFRTNKRMPGYEYNEITPDDKPGEYTFVFKKKASDTDLQSIGRYVTNDVLKKYNMRPVSQYSFVGKSKKLGRDVVHIFKANENFPIFLLDEGSFKKIYKPYEQEKKYRFMYVGNKPKHYVFGLKQIMEADNEFTASDDEDPEAAHPPQHKPDARVREMFRCSGESDALNLATLGCHVYWLNSESAELTYDQYKEIDKYTETHYQIMDLDATGHKYALQNALDHFNLYTIELPAWLKQRTDWRNNPCKDLKDFINVAGNAQDETLYDFTVLKRNARRVKFWTRHVEKKRVTYNINMEFFYFFLKANGFYQMESQYHKKAGYCYVHIQKEKVVELIHPDNIKRVVKRFTKDWIKRKKIMEGIELLNKINTSAQISEGNLETIEEIKLNFKNHSKHTEYISFKNGSLRITHDKIEKVRHDELPNYILGKLEVNKDEISHICPRDIRMLSKPPIEVNASEQYANLINKLNATKTPTERENVNALLARLDEIDKYEVIINNPDFIFVQFLQDLSYIHWRKVLERNQELTELELKEQNLVLANLLFMMGYHCQQFKDPSKPWITFLQDMKISEIGEASGRSGKSLISKAPTYVRASFYKGGRELDDKNKYTFFYDGFTEFHDYIEIDDLAEYADINFFYTQITGKREVNPKNYTPFTLNYEDSGKMLISSNYELPNVNSSTVARMLNAGVSDYYHEETRYNDYKETRSPYIKFGRLLYDDFTDEEWVMFYNQMAYCIQMQMRFFKIQPPMTNLLKRQARRSMSQGLGKDEAFFQWANDYFQMCPEKELPMVSPEHSGYLNTFIIKQVAFENFQQRLSFKQKQDYRINKFKQHVISFCEYWGYELNPRTLKDVDSGGRILKTIDSKTAECFYISTANAPNVPQPVHNEPLNNLTHDNDEEDMPF